MLEAANDKQMDFFRSLVKSLVDENPHSAETIASALAVMAQGTTPLLLTDVPAGNKKRKRLTDAESATFRVEVGRSHGAGPGNIVGAIANEANLQNGEIGKIKMMDRFSFIDLPSSLSEDTLDILRNVQVSGQRLQISRSEGNRSGGSGRSGGDRNNRRRSNNGSTDFTKRNQKPFRGRKSISRSEGFGGSDSGSSTKSGGYKSKPNSISTKARLSKSSSSSSEGKSFDKPARKSKPAKAKAAKKYIKVRTKK